MWKENNIKEVKYVVFNYSFVVMLFVYFIIVSYWLFNVNVVCVIKECFFY